MSKCFHQTNQSTQQALHILEIYIFVLVSWVSLAEYLLYSVFVLVCVQLLQEELECQDFKTSRSGVYAESIHLRMFFFINSCEIWPAC